jgi:hypothetical protein
MKTNQLTMIVEIDKSLDLALTDIHTNHQSPETEYKMSSGGSSQVLGDFFEFTDYLIPINRSTRYAKTEDYYSELFSL